MGESWGTAVSRSDRARKEKERKAKARRRKKKVNAVKHPVKTALKRYGLS